MLIESIPKGAQSQIQSSGPDISLQNSGAQVGNGAEMKPPVRDFSEMRELAADLQKNIKMLNNVGLAFSIHQSSGKVVVTVTDEETGKVIREIPGKEMLNLSAKLEEMIGIIFDRKV